MYNLKVIILGFVRTLISIMLFATMLFTREKAEIQVDSDPSITYNGRNYILIQSENQATSVDSREEIILWEEDFENNAEEWTTGSGWQITTDKYNSETHSMNSPNDLSTINGTYNLLSPILSLPELGDGETMNFSFWIYVDQPDYSQTDDPNTSEDESNYLADYYIISLFDLSDLAWHSSDMNSNVLGGQGANYWCADEDEVGGYLDNWIQYLDTPSILVGNGASLSAKIFYAIESNTGASVSGSCADGWDAANARISIDGGATWELLQDPSQPYHFDCGYAWIRHDSEYDAGGSLNHLAPGWAGLSNMWLDFNADLSMYADQEVIVRFAFGSDPAFSTNDDPGITGFQVDAINVSDDSGLLYSNNGDDESTVVISGEIWADQFYDYGDAARPGYQAWEEYIPGMAFNGNVFMDISELAGKDIIFKVQSRYDDNNDGGQGDGLFIDDIKIYKISGGNYPAPIGLTAEAGDSEAMLSWYDMNASGTDDFVYHNGSFSDSAGITLNDPGTAWAGERFDLFGPSTIDIVRIHSTNSGPVEVTIGGFRQLGTLFDIEPMYSMDVTLQPGENIFDVSWDMNNSFIIAQTFTDIIIAGMDTSPVSDNSMVSLGVGWDPWSDYETTIIPGEFGISAIITYAGAGVTYNLYRDGAMAASGITSNMHTDSGLTNNVTYEYTLSATYSDGEESEESAEVSVTPFSETVYEKGYDDGSFESEFNAGSGNFSAVRFSADSSGEDIVRFTWFQNGSGGAFYIKVFEDGGGIPGAESYSAVQASGNVDGWNAKDLSTHGLSVSGDFWIGAKEFSTSRPFGLDTDSDSGNSYQRAGSTGDWTAVNGNLGYHVYLDCGSNCENLSMSNDNNMIPYKFGLREIFPNPFNPTANIEYEISEFGLVEIIIYDINGRMMNTLVNDYKYPGYYSILWNGFSQNNQMVASGIYLVVLQSGRKLFESRKLVLLK